MPLTAGQPAMMVARLGTMRLGASRLGYYEPIVTITINGVVLTGDAKALAVDDLTITDLEGGTPNTATLRVTGVAPVEGQEIRIGLGGLGRGQIIFAGHILHATQVYVGGASNIHYDLSCISYEWLLNDRPLTRKFLSTSATDIALWMMSGVTGFSTAIEAGLPVLDEFTVTNVDRTDGLDRLAKRCGGAWVVDYRPVLRLHFGLAIAPWASAIHPITTADPHGMEKIARTTDLSQVRTRVEVEGGGANATAHVLAGTPTLPIGDPSWYRPAGGTVVSGPQRIEYAGVVEGGGGALVGTTLTPTNGPTVTRKTATGLSAGAFGWAVSFGTAAGRTLPSPITAATLGGAIAPPANPPTVARLNGGSLGLGVYKWKTAFKDAAGRVTLLSGESSSLTMEEFASTPSSIGTASTSTGTVGSLDASAAYGFKGTWTKGSMETLPSPAETFTTGSVSTERTGRLSKAGLPDPPSGWSWRFYRTEGGGGTYKRMNGSVNEGFTGSSSSFWLDSAADGTLGATAPTVSTATFRKANIALPTSTDPNITEVAIYRTKANGSTFYHVTDVANGTGSYVDDTTDASLTDVAPTSATAIYLSADLSNIPIGPTGTTYRDLFRTVADGAQLKLLGTLSNNTVTVLADTTADGSLGANAPSTDTSGLVSESGEVAAGSTSLLVTSTAPFQAGGGWALIGALSVRYTGVSGTALTGVPPTGPGSLGSTLRYGSEVIAAHMLTGIPTSGAGAILYTIPAGEPVNIFITRNDLAAQAMLAALLTTPTRTHDGIVVEPLQDRRKSQTECENLGDARLAEVKDPLVALSYQTTDLTHRSGREVTFALDPPTNIAGTFKVQRVTLSQFEGGRSRPIRTVEASSRRLSFEAILRLLKAA